jgi:probable addiction module antidote protein
MPFETVPFDATAYLTDEQSQIELIADALQSGDAGYIAAALGTVARAVGMTAIAQRSGLTREALYKSLSEAGDPKLSTLLAVIKSLGLGLAITKLPAETKQRRRSAGVRAEHHRRSA